MKARPSSFFILGMLRLGATSGYAIKKATDISMRYFWPTSLAQVYPELGRLEEQGMVVRHDDSHGNRARAAYEVTEQGKEAMLEWLRGTEEEPLRLRDEGILRLYFADALPLPDQLRLARRLRERSGETGRELREDVVPLGEILEKETGTRFPGTIARFGADVFAFAEEWFAKLEEELAEELAQESDEPAQKSEELAQESSESQPPHSGASSP
jgi:DNA-binding PadR family transcriptional regulator